MRKGIKSVWNVVAVMIIGAMLATILPASLAKATSLEDSSLSPQSADPAIAKASKLTIAAIAELAGLSSSEGGINLQYLGHSAFVLTTSEGHEIWMDHSSRSGYTFYFPNVVPDLVTVTHNHYDHRPWTWTGFIFIDPESEWGQKFLEWKERVPVLMGVTGLNNNIYHQIDKVFNWGLRVYTVETKHYSRAEDSRRGRNAVFVYEVKGLRIVHLGYLGHLLTESQINSIGCPDVLLIPVGGTYTLGASQETRMMEQIQPRPPTPQAVEVMKQLQPRITIPMHYKTEKSAVGELAGVEEFLEQATQFAKVKEFEGHSVNINGGGSP